MKETISIHEVIDKLGEELYEGMEQSPQIEEILDSREETYGEYPMNAIIAQGLKEHVRMGTNWYKLKSAHKEALDMICSKMARVVNGDANHTDNFIDIQGYAELAEKECK